MNYDSVNRNSVNHDSLLIQKGDELNMFIGREKDLRKLTQIYDSNKFEFGIIHGRRRIGKTTLLKESIKSRKSIYFLAQQANEKTNLELFSKVYTQSKQMGNLIFASFNDFFEALFQEDNTIFIIDEFSYLTSTSPSIESILQGYIDNKKYISNIKLIISGSEIGMFDNLFSHSKPLFNRQTFQMQIKECDYYESSLYYENFSNEDKLKAYAIFGGLPYYLSQIDDQLSLKQNICNLIIDPNAQFSDEIKLILNSELRSIEEYQSILQAVHSGSTKLSQIDTKSHIEQTSKTIKYLNKLIQLELIEKEFCFQENQNSKKFLYRIANNFIAFYYRFIWPNEHSRYLMDNDAFYEYYISSHLDHYVSLRFEQMCQQFLKRCFNKRNNAIMVDMGRYWYNDPIEKKEVEIDVCVKTTDHLYVYECKWTNSKIDRSIMETLKYKGKSIFASQYGSFSRSGFDHSISTMSYDLISIDDMFKIK